MMWQHIRRNCRKRRHTSSGFTLLEALVAIALMGVILAGLASITSQWLPNWNRGIARAQRAELVRLALDRLVADLGASEFISPNRDSNAPLFDGTEYSVTLVRSAIGPNTRPGLEIVRIAEIDDKGGQVLVRATKPFAPLPSNTILPRPSDFANQTVLLRSPYQISFAYAGRDNIWRKNWQNADRLPAAVSLTVRDATTGRTLTISTTALVHVELPATCTGSKGKDDCIGSPDPNRQPGNSPGQANVDKDRT
jgi:general secretion pathway protein J